MIPLTMGQGYLSIGVTSETKGRGGEQAIMDISGTRF